MNTAKTGFAQMTIAMVISGSIGLLVLKSGQSPADVVFLRCAIAFACLLPVCLLHGDFVKSNLKPQRIAMMVASGLLLISNWVLLFKAFPTTSISLATIVYHVNPFIILGLGALFVGERVQASDVGWAMVAFVGLLVIIGVGSVSYSPTQLQGLCLVLAATTLYSCCVVITKKLSGTPPLFILLFQTATGALAMLPLISAPGHQATPGQWGAIVALGLVHTVLLYWLIYSAMAKLRLGMIAMLSFLYPISTVAFDYVFFDRVITWSQSLGAVLILVATIGVKLHWPLLGRLSRKEPTSPVP